MRERAPLARLYLRNILANYSSMSSSDVNLGKTGGQDLKQAEAVRTAVQAGKKDWLSVGLVTLSMHQVFVVARL